jgi:hypothetical protein
MEKTCTCCKRIFVTNLRITNQRYCNRTECQRARKRKWQREKLATDSAYRDNQTAARKEWSRRNKDYWNKYRKRNPAYTERNRLKQRTRNRRKKSEIAKMDASGSKSAISSGRYQLVPLSGDMIAKMDALIVEINVVSRGCSMEAQSL